MLHFKDFLSRYNYMTGLISVVDKDQDFSKIEIYLVKSIYQEGLVELVFPLLNIIRGYVSYLKDEDNNIDKDFPLDDFIKHVESEQAWWVENYSNFTDELHKTYKFKDGDSVSDYINGYSTAFLDKFKKEVENGIWNYWRTNNR